MGHPPTAVAISAECRVARSAAEALAAQLLSQLRCALVNAALTALRLLAQALVQTCLPNRTTTESAATGL
jgi:hypothetical protein